MNDFPLISIVMSVYNSERYLSEAIDSMLNQTFQDFEFIIINDGSTDRSLPIIQSYMKKDSRIVLISRENKGLPYSLNEGIKKAKGKYIARMDADDISMPERFQKQVFVLESDPSIGVCGASALYFKNDDRTRTELFSPPKAHDKLKVALLYSSCFIHPTVMMRRSEINKLDCIYDEKFQNSQDYELWSRLVSKTKLFNIQEPLLYYRINVGSISTLTNSNSLEKRFPLLKSLYIKKFNELDLSPSESFTILHFYIGINAELKKADLKYAEVSSYIDVVLNANRTAKKYNQFYLYAFLSRRYFVFSLYSLAKTKNLDLNLIKNSYFFVGLFSMLCHKVRKLVVLSLNFVGRFSFLHVRQS